MSSPAAEDLENNPFAVLGATTRDDRGRILQLADSMSLEIDEGVCNNAQADLVNPRTRLVAEIAWLPGVSPRKANRLFEMTKSDPLSVRGETGLPVLAHLNLFAAVWRKVDLASAPTDVAFLIEELALLFGKLSPEDVRRDINEDRIAAGFPEILTLDQIEAELLNRGRHYRSCIRSALERLPDTALHSVMTELVEQATGGGVSHAPVFIDHLVDSYELDTKALLEKTTAKATRLLRSIRTSRTSEELMMGYIERLDVLARRWNSVARPIRLSVMARGMEHEPSTELANAIRNAAIRLSNNREMLRPSLRMLTMLQELFADIPEIEEKVSGDLTQLAREETDSQLIREWESIITKCEAAVTKAEEEPQFAHSEALQLIAARTGLVVSESVPLRVRIRSRNAYATSLERLANLFGYHTGDWASCISLYSEALRCVWDDEIGKRIQEKLNAAKLQARRRREVEPIASAPSQLDDHGTDTTLSESTDVESTTDPCKDQVVLRDDSGGLIGRLLRLARDKWSLAISIAVIAAWLVGKF